MLNDLLKMPEGKTLEFKRDLSSIKPILKTIVAFANTAGGSLFLGIDDNKEIVGINDPLAVEEKLTSLISDHIAPALLPTIKILTIEDKSILWVEVPFLATMGPFYLKQEGIEKGTLIRLGSTSRLATPEMIEEIRRNRKAQSFDAAPCVHTSYHDLDHTLIKNTFAQVGQEITKSKLKTLKILVPYGNEDIPSNAGIILFAKPEVRVQFFPSAYVSCARFAGTEKVDFIDQLDIERVIDAIDQVPAFIRRNTRVGAEIKEIRRKDIPEYPTVAIREGLLNALMHADYSYIGMRIFISIFDDRLEIRSPGCLPPGMTLDGLKEGVSIPRNLVIARVFHLLGWVEQFGTGYFRIKQACDAGGYPLPIWREVGPYTDIIFKPITTVTYILSTGSEQSLNHMAEPSSEYIITKSGPSRDQVGTRSGPGRDQVGTKSRLGEKELKILSLCATATPINSLMVTLGWKNRTKFRHRYILPLLEEGLITMTVPDKPSSRSQKYLLTEKGAQELESI